MSIADALAKAANARSAVNTYRAYGLEAEAVRAGRTAKHWARTAKKLQGAERRRVRLSAV